MDKRTGLALVIGIDPYGSGIPPLQSARHDASTLAELLRTQHGYEVTCLLDGAATKARCHEALQALIAGAGPSDRVVFYFAGHGLADTVADPARGPSGFLIPADARRDDPHSFWPMHEVQGALAKTQSLHLLVLLDCCFAGAFRWAQGTRNLVVRRARLSRQRFERYLRDPARVVITSAAHDERALDTVAGKVFGERATLGGHSPFAMALLEGLRGEADRATGGALGDGIILTSELYVFVEQAMERLEQRLGAPVQRPLLFSFAGADKGEFVFTVPGRAPTLPDAEALSDRDKNPYRGLEPYRTEHRNLFFGRQTATAALTARVLAQPLTVLVGASGSGKTSLVQAGLIPSLRALPDGAFEILPTVRPCTDAIPDLQRALAEGAQPEAGAGAESGPARQLLFVDQLEDLITLRRSELPQFLATVKEAIQSSGGRLHVVMTLRSDFESHFRDLLKSEGGADVRFMIPHFTRAELREAVEGPAAECTLFFEPPALVDELIDEVLDAPGALPLLSFVLAEMVRGYARSGREDRTLYRGDYQALGGVVGALGQRADEIVGALDAAQEQALSWLLFRMIVPGDWTRRRVFAEELELADAGERARTESVLHALMEARLVVKPTDRQGRTLYEPAHDKLVLGWSRLREMFEKQRQLITVRADLCEATRKWRQGGSHRGQLWNQDHRLAFLRAQPGATAYLSRDEQAFFAASWRLRRTIQAAVGGATLLIFVSLLLALGLYVRWFRDMRRHWEESRLLISDLLTIVHRSPGDLAVNELREDLFAEISVYSQLAKQETNPHEAHELSAEVLYCKSLLEAQDGLLVLAQAHAAEALREVDAALKLEAKDPRSRLARGMILLQLSELATRRSDTSSALGYAIEAAQTARGMRHDHRQAYILLEAHIKRGQAFLPVSLPKSYAALIDAQTALRQIVEQWQPAEQEGVLRWSMRKQRLEAELILSWAEHAFRSHNLRQAQQQAAESCKRFGKLQAKAPKSRTFAAQQERCAALSGPDPHLP